MQIVLSQPEIAKAIQLYIVKQGINTVGKDVSMQFTAGRKEQGITVQISIEDSADIPGFGAEDAEFDAPVIVTEAIEPEPVPVAAPVTQLRAAPELPTDPPFHTEAKEDKPARKTVGSFLPEAIPPVINKKLEAVTEVTITEAGDLTIHPTPVTEPVEPIAAIAEPARKTTSLFS